MNQIIKFPHGEYPPEGTLASYTDQDGYTVRIDALTDRTTFVGQYRRGTMFITDPSGNTVQGLYWMNWPEDEWNYSEAEWVELTWQERAALEVKQQATAYRPLWKQYAARKQKSVEMIIDEIHRTGYSYKDLGEYIEGQLRNVEFVRDCFTKKSRGDHIPHVFSVDPLQSRTSIMTKYVIWWLDQSAYEMAVVLGAPHPSWPEYITVLFPEPGKITEYLEKIQTVEFHNVLDKHWYKDGSIIKPPRAYGMMIKRSDIHHVLSWPGYVSDETLMPITIQSQGE